MKANYSAPRRDAASFRHLGHLKHLAPYARKHSWLLAAAILGLLVTRIFDAIVPQLIRTGVDSLVDPMVPPNLVIPALGILGVIVARFGIYVWARRALRRISVSVAYDLRKQLFDHLQVQGPNFFHRISTGDLMSRAINDVAMVRMVVSFGWVTIVMFFFSIATALYFMILMSPELTLWVVLPLPLVAVTGFVMSRGLFPYMRDQQEAMATISSFTQENLNGIRTIQAMAQEDEEIRRFHEVCTQYAARVYRATRYQAVIKLAMPFLASLSTVIILLHGGNLVLEGQMTLGTFTAFFAYLAMVSTSVGTFGFAVSMFTSAAAGTERIFEVLLSEPEIEEPRAESRKHGAPGHEAASEEVAFDSSGEIRGDLEVRNLTYSPPGAPRPALSGVDLQVSAGETVAILGRVGSGKSTLLKAIVRLVNVDEGSVFVDGADVCRFPLRRLRGVAAYVPQNPFLFSTTLRENLTYDDPSRGDDSILSAVDAAGLGDALARFSEGLDTVVGERGITLSGGQKQRATLARALIRESEILLIDDCFSSVDTATEEQILSGLQRMRKGRTTLLVSHRVSTARHADRIVVLDEGSVLEEGTHRELLAQGGYYADLEAAQRSREAPEPGTSKSDLEAESREERDRKDRLTRHLRGLSGKDPSEVEFGRGKGRNVARGPEAENERAGDLSAEDQPETDAIDRDDRP